MNRRHWSVAGGISATVVGALVGLFFSETISKAVVSENSIVIHLSPSDSFIREENSVGSNFNDIMVSVDKAIAQLVAEIESRDSRVSGSQINGRVVLETQEVDLQEIGLTSESIRLMIAEDYRYSPIELDSYVLESGGGNFLQTWQVSALFALFALVAYLGLLVFVQTLVDQKSRGLQGRASRSTP